MLIYFAPNMGWEEGGGGCMHAQKTAYIRLWCDDATTQFKKKKRKRKEKEKEK
jgi:hypothetical protein